MAELNHPSEQRTLAGDPGDHSGAAPPWSAAQTRAQFAAVGRLRWQMFRNGLRRKGGKSDLWAMLAMTPVAVLILGGLCVEAGMAAGLAVTLDHTDRVSWELWFIFALSQLVNLNVGQPGTTFDPTQLIRFPMTAANYTAMRLFFGMLSPGNVIVMMMSLSAAIGITFASPSLAGWAFVAMAVFAAVNVLFTRMVFAWVDRWISTRRAREAMTALIFLVSIGGQTLNFLYNPAYHNRRVDLKTVQRVQHEIARVEPYLRVLPPELAGDSIVAAASGKDARFARENLAAVAWGSVFLLVFGLRMRTEYRGENLSDSANAVRARKPKQEIVTARAGLAQRAEFVASASRPMDVVRAVGAKELLYLRRNTGLFYGLIAPLVMVMIFAGRWAVRAGDHGPLIFVAALAYGLLGVFPMSFNSFGLEGTGAQTYFFAPVRLREVMIGKNLLCGGVALVETLAIVVVLGYSSGARPPALFLVGALLWMATTLLLQLTVGNYMSIRSPKRIDPGRMAQKQARQASAFLSMGIMLGSGMVAAAVTFLAGLGHVIWVVPLVFACTAAGAAWIYWMNLNKLEAYAWLHRDELFEELQRKT